MMSSSVGYSARSSPTQHDLQRAADILNEGKRVAILVGQGAANATDEVLAVADRLDAGIAKALLGKYVVPDDLPYVTGTLGLLGTRPSSDMMNECDTLLMVGTCYPYSEFLPKEGSGTGHSDRHRRTQRRIAVSYRSQSDRRQPCNSWRRSYRC